MGATCGARPRPRSSHSSQSAEPARKRERRGGATGLAIVDAYILRKIIICLSSAQVLAEVLATATPRSSLSTFYADPFHARRECLDPRADSLPHGNCTGVTAIDVRSPRCCCAARSAATLNVADDSSAARPGLLHCPRAVAFSAHRRSFGESHEDHRQSAQATQPVRGTCPLPPCRPPPVECARAAAAGRAIAEARPGTHETKPINSTRPHRRASLGGHHHVEPEIPRRQRSRTAAPLP